MSSVSPIDWKKVKVVIFDVDGTLYPQSPLRKRMMRSLLSYYAVRPWRFSELKMLQRFREEREKRPGYALGNLEEAQYEWCLEKGNYPVAKLKSIVNRWMFVHPNQYLAQYMYGGVAGFFNALRDKGIKIAIYSDFKAHDKLTAMGLKADLIVSSTDPEVDRLKPDPAGLLYITRKLAVSPGDCVFIGDRPELDGICAQKANMPYLILDKNNPDILDFYKNLENQLNVISSKVQSYETA